jgi:UPF0716 protein FxsA
MSLINKLLLFFVALPLIELCLMVLLSYYITLPGTIIFILGTGVLGAFLANTQGLSVYRRIQEEISQGRMPTDSLLDGVLILIAGLLLITPGVLTDLTGIILMIPFTRGFCRRWLIGWFQRHFKIKTLVPGPRPTPEGVVDSYATEGSSEPVEPRRVP